MGRLLLTGFGPFGDAADNPSEHLARGCGYPHHVLPVAYQPVREFISNLEPHSFDCLLLLGLHSTSEAFHLEALAKNWVQARPDTTGFRPAPGEIRPGAPNSINGTLWPTLQLQNFVHRHPARFSINAGEYLCNFIYYEALFRFPEKRVGFLHVPKTNHVSLDRQARALSEIIESI